MKSIYIGLAPPGHLVQESKDKNLLWKFKMVIPGQGAGPLSYLREKNSIPDVCLSWVQKVGRGLVRSKSLNRHPPVG